ncbi:hypothetical protein [Desulfatirhabdium butyrativorans]|uniref:hypothetical protein n=1 Tax=Desulfatirhabdium butyrativorans TaxID=340467 RepID=UPI000487268E|nr:hypothetical protein [Desulfatirhabdium butyrativorans]
MADKGKDKAVEDLENLENSVETVLAETVADIAGRAIKPELQPFTKKIDAAVETLEDLIGELREFKRQQTSEAADTRAAVSNIADRLGKTGTEVSNFERQLCSIAERLKTLTEISSHQGSRLKVMFIVFLAFDIILLAGLVANLLIYFGK